MSSLVLGEGRGVCGGYGLNKGDVVVVGMGWIAKGKQRSAAPNTTSVFCYCMR